MHAALEGCRMGILSPSQSATPSLFSHAGILRPGAKAAHSYPSEAVGSRVEGGSGGEHGFGLRWDEGAGVRCGAGMCA